MKKGDKNWINPMDMVDVSRFPRSEGEYTFLH